MWGRRSVVCIPVWEPRPFPGSLGWQGRSELALSRNLPDLSGWHSSMAGARPP